MDALIESVSQFSCDSPTDMQQQTITKFNRKEPLVIRYIRHQIKQGYSPLILFVGRQRVGKTAMAMRMAYDLDNTWTNDLMTFKIEDFLQLYNKHSKKILILDEASIGLDPYEHMMITQRIYRHIIDTQAYKQNIVFIVLPFAKGIGRTHRDYVNIIINVRARGFYVAKAVVAWHDDLSYKPPFTWILEEIYDVPLPPTHIWEPYIKSGQKIYKENIMELQMTILERKKVGNSSRMNVVNAV